jgi:hypothetical protein
MTNRKLTNYLTKCRQTVAFHLQGLKSDAVAPPKGKRIDPQTAKLVLIRWDALEPDRRAKLEALEPERAIALLSDWTRVYKPA